MLNGDIHSIYREFCPFTPQPFQVKPKNMIEAYGSDSLLKCGLFAFIETGILDNITQTEINSKLPTDDRILSFQNCVTVFNP
jgi:hypothetical protein